MSMHRAPHSKGRIFLLEDDAGLRCALQFLLESEGYEVHAFADGEDLLAETFPVRDACLVVDQRLPGLSGVEVLMNLRSRGIGLPAIIITTHPKAPLRLAAVAARAAIVEKPLVGDALLAHVRASFAALDA